MGLIPVQRKLAPDDVHAVRIAHLTDPGATVKVLAAQYRVHENTIRAYLEGPQYEKVKTDLQSEMTRTAKDILYTAAENAARAWAEQAVRIAAEKGDHRPARDLLAAIDAIHVSGGDKPSSVVVQIGLSLTDLHSE